MSARPRPAPASSWTPSTRAACSPPETGPRRCDMLSWPARADPDTKKTKKGRTRVLTRRALMGAAASLLAGARDAAAQEWPQRPIRIIVAFGPGGGSDIVGRIIAQSMQEKLG